MSDFKKRFDLLFDEGKKAVSVRGNAAAVAEIFGGDSKRPDHDLIENQYKYVKRGWAFASVRPIGARLAERHLRMARRVTQSPKSRGNEFPVWVKQVYGQNVELIDRHPLLSLIESPNQFMTGWALMWLTAMSLQATGKAHWWFKSAEELWFVPAHMIFPVINDKGRRTGWKIGENETNSLPVDEEEIAYFYYPDPCSPMEACGPLQAASRPILSSDAIHESQYCGFMGGHMPDHAFILGPKVRVDGTKEVPELTKDQREELTARLRQMYGGPKNHGKFMLLDGMISEVKRLSMAPTEMDYMASSKLVQDEIIKMFGTPLVSMGGVETATRASALVAEEVFATNVLNPTLQMFGQVLTAWLKRSKLFSDVNKQSELICFYDEIRPTDTQEELRKYQIAYDRGIIGDDDFRMHVLHMPPKADGSGRVARINAALATVPVAPSEPATRLSRATSDILVKAKTQWSAAFSMGEKSIKSSVMAVFRSLNEELIAAGESGSFVWSTLQTSSFSEKLKNSLRKALADAGRHGMAVEVALAKDFGVVEKSVLDEIMYGDNRSLYMRSYVDDLLRLPYWDGIVPGYMDEVQSLIRQAGRDGLSTREITESLMSSLPHLSEARAERISLTEATGAVNAGAHSTRLSVAPLISHVEWSTLLDMNTRGARPDDRFNHMAMDGQTVELGQDFNVGGELAPFPGHYSLSAGNRVNCRCITLTHLRIP